jgi:hypothetical protein
MPEGMVEATVNMRTNDRNNPVQPITIRAQNWDSNIKIVEGNITDVRFDKQTDILYFTTSQPNRFTAYDTRSKTILRELVLDKEPTCFSISEDRSKAIIGYGGKISIVNMANFTVAKEFETDQDVFDIDWVDASGCCYDGGNNYLYWLDVNTGNTTSSSKNYGNYMVRKIPGYIVANTQYEALFYDLSRSEKKPAITIRDMGNIWFSEDGAFIYGESSIFRLSSFLSQGHVLSDSYLPYPSDNNSISWIDHHAATNSIWILPLYDFNKRILQYDDSRYTLVKSYYYEDNYDNPVQPQYVFANGAGTELTVIRETYDIPSAWSLEFIPAGIRN